MNENKDLITTEFVCRFFEAFCTGDMARSTANQDAKQSAVEKKRKKTNIQN